MTEPITIITSIIAITISALALFISTATAWLLYFRRGTVKMTQPTQIFFGFDKPRPGMSQPWPKVFLRTLLFSTSKRGRVIENLYVTLSCKDISQDFNVWVYGEKQELVRGSGLFVSETGVEAYHHFLVTTGVPFNFISGRYQMAVYARLLGIKRSQLLFSQELEMREDEVELIGEQNTGLYFDWDPIKELYVHHLNPGPKSFWEK